MGVAIYNVSEDIYGSRRPFDTDDDSWVESSLYARRHDGLYKSRLEMMQEEWLAEQENSDM